MRIHRQLAGLVITAGLGIASPALADDAEIAATTSLGTPVCTDGHCTVKMTADQVLETAEKLVNERHFDEAAPLLAALENAPQLAMQRNFLLGYSAIESGETDKAIKIFRSILANHPEQTRVRLELARALMLRGNSLGADYHFRLASQDPDVPQDVAAMVRGMRGILRTRKSFSFNVDFGFAPDSNITNGTNAQTINVSFGDLTIPLTLDADARRKSGTGQFASLSGTARVNFVGASRLLIDMNGSATNYAGKDHDDFNAELAAGPEFEVGSNSKLAVQALGSQRWLGGKRAASAFGARASLQKDFDGGSRVGFSLDARRTISGFVSDYSGWQMGAYASYERGIGKTLIASASLFGRRDLLNSTAYSDKELGLSLGLAGELPLGLTAGLNGGVSRAWFDSPLGILSSSARNDLRFNGSFNLGLRSLRALGFSPSIAVSYVKNQSNVALFNSERKRIRFALARYF